jgi:hypothetical protein
MGENYAPINAVIADFNGDGVADVATAAQYGTGKYGYNAALDLFLRCK